MDEAEKHYPGQPEPEAPAPEAPKPEEPKPEEKTPETPADDAPEGKPEADKPEDTPPAKPDEPTPPLKKRSIYDDYRDKKKELREAETTLETERAARAAAETKAQELQALLDAKKDAATPEAKAEAADDIKAFAEKHGMSADALRELTSVILKQVPKGEQPAGLSEEDKQKLAEVDGLRTWKQEQEAKATREAEDRAILNEASSVKTLLDVHDDIELQAVMAEIVKLAHTAAFHDKEVEYIVWKNKDALSKLVSPKKPSFEPTGQQPGTDTDTEIDFSDGGKLTPEAAGKAAMKDKPKSSLEVRSGR